MNTTQLNMIVYDNPDPKVIYLQDTSTYNPDLEVTCPRLEITPPNYTTRYIIEYPTLSLIPINSNALGWTTTNSYEVLSDLPDGLWKFVQSVAPNDKIYRSYNYFRITNLKSAILDKLNEKLTDNPDCNNDNLFYQEIFMMVNMLESAKYMAEQCDKTAQAVIIYNNVNNQYKQILCDC